ncbi:MAG: ABC transporter substrate-binding protein, partial [Bacteroidales bacterium]|nr:ABC transporter substrate-binding protein [Bacteroidales bacterium]
EEGIRIISLVPSFTKEIVQLGMKDHIVGATSYCDISKENKDLIVGSVIDINEEKIMLLKPDLVLVSGLVKEKSIQILKQNGINVKYINNNKSFKGLCEQFIQIGEVIGKEAYANQLVQQAVFSLDSLKALVPHKEEKLKVCFQLGANPIAVVIPNTFMNDYITFAGGINIFNDLDKIIVNRESVLLRNPDCIIISSMGIVGEQEKEIWEEYEEISAVKNDMIFTVTSASTPTVSDFIENLGYIINQIYDDKT